MAKIDIYSGFLGAGKTTLIKKLLREAYVGEKVVLIENEFGEIGIDGGFLRDAGIEITEMNSGCICCSLVGDFTKALEQVLERFSPDRIIIEPSGVGKLSDVIRAVRSVRDERAVLNCFTTVVDAKKCKMYMKNFGEFFNDQIQHASAIFLSHTDTATDERVREAVELLRTQNAEAAIVTTPMDQLDGKEILAALEKKNTLADILASLEEESRDAHEHHHHHDDEDHHCCHGDEDEDAHEHHHHHDDDDDHHCCHGDEDEDAHEHHHHHDDDDHHCCHGDEDEDAHEHHHHHDDDDHHCCHGDEDEDAHEHHQHDGECHCGHHHHHGHDADEVFESWGTETVRKFTAEELRRALEEFAEDTSYGVVLRAKGIVAGQDGQWIHFDYVPGEPDVRFGTADVTGRLCVIGSHLDQEKIQKLFGV